MSDQIITQDTIEEIRERYEKMLAPGCEPSDDDWCSLLDDHATLLDKVDALEKESARKTSDLLNADRKIKRLRKIAAHVPGKIYIVAKEKAGYATTIVEQSTILHG